VHTFGGHDHAWIVLELAVASVGHPVSFQLLSSELWLDFMQPGHWQFFLIWNKTIV